MQLISGLDSADWTRSAQLHQALIDKFGRFPGRNATLGRQSTPAEIEALKGPNASF